MKTLQRLSTSSSCAASMLFGFGGYASMSPRDERRAVDAGAGAVARPVLTGGSGVGAESGAAVGGVISHEVVK